MVRIPDSKREHGENAVEASKRSSVIEAYAEALQFYGICSVPYLQRKCSVTHKAAKEFMDAKKGFGHGKG